jgi:hypothetical protein
VVLVVVTVVVLVTVTGFVVVVLVVVVEVVVVGIVVVVLVPTVIPIVITRVKLAIAIGANLKPLADTRAGTPIIDVREATLVTNSNRISRIWAFLKPKLSYPVDCWW